MLYTLHVGSIRGRYMLKSPSTASTDVRKTGDGTILNPADTC
jgi:hypothetical protein